MEDEHAEVGRLGELLRDPRVAAASDLAVVEVGLGRVDRDDGRAVHVDDRVPRAEELLEVDVADVARVVVSRDDDQALAVELREVLGRLGVLGPVAERREVAGADDDVRLQVVHLDDRAVQQVGDEVRRPAVEVGDVGDSEHCG